MDAKRGTDLNERIKIQEKALQELAGRIERHEAGLDEDLREALEEIKAIKLFLTRAVPDFKNQFPELRKKIKKAA